MKLIVVVGFTFMAYGWCLLAYAAESTECNAGATPQASVQTLSDTPLPERDRPHIQTSGTVPHVQLGVDPVAALNKELFRLAFNLPGLEKRPTIVSLPGGIGMWLTDDVPVVHPKAIVSGREFAHIHTDGSLHAPVPFKRALELEKKGWGERHPWADRRDGWEGFVMLYSASTEEELKTLVQLIAESYNYVTGRSVQAPGC
jgi:hypothetical protein